MGLGEALALSDTLRLRLPEGDSVPLAQCVADRLGLTLAVGLTESEGECVGLWDSVPLLVRDCDCVAVAHALWLCVTLVEKVALCVSGNWLG